MGEEIEDDGPITWNGTGTWLGIDNSLGTEPVAGEVTIHFENQLDLAKTTNVCVEFVFGSAGPAGLSLAVVPTAPSVVVDYDLMQDYLGSWSGMEWWRGNYWAHLDSSPSWEDIRFELTADAGAMVVLDSVFVATESVPEPATLGLLALGGLGLLRRRRGFRRR